MLHGVKVRDSLCRMGVILEIFHITPTRATMVQKSTKYVKYTVCFPMGNFSFICGTHE